MVREIPIKRNNWKAQRICEFFSAEIRKFTSLFFCTFIYLYFITNFILNDIF